MFRPKLTLTPLEDRTTPVLLKFTATISLDSITPPQDPMDNPPPAQPGTGGGSTGSTTPVSPPPPPGPSTT